MSLTSELDPGWVAVAVLGKTRGLHGEVTALPLSGRPERYGALREVFLFGAGHAAEGAPFEVESTWFHNGVLIFKFRGVDSIDSAERLNGAEVRVPLSQRMPLEPGFRSPLKLIPGRPPSPVLTSSIRFRHFIDGSLSLVSLDLT